MVTQLRSCMQLLHGACVKPACDYDKHNIMIILFYYYYAFLVYHHTLHWHIIVVL